jgi:hypothetical protein
MTNKKSAVDVLSDSERFGAVGSASALVDAIERQQRMFEPLDRIANSSLGKLDVFEQMARGGFLDHLGLVDKTALAFADLGGRGTLFESMRRHQEMFEHTTMLASVYGSHKALFDAGVFSDVTSLRDFTKTLGSPFEMTRAYDTIARLQESIARSYAVDHVPLWGAHLATIAAPSSALLGTGMFDRATGILSAFDAIGASLAWLRPDERGEPTFAAAALVKRSPPKASSVRRINVSCNVQCSICDDPMLVQAKNFHWESDDEIVIDLGVVPICSACTRRAQDDPSYWSEHLAHLMRPRFELIDGGGDGGGEPAAEGILRIVDDDERDA